MKSLVYETPVLSVEDLFARISVTTEIIHGMTEIFGNFCFRSKVSVTVTSANHFRPTSSEANILRGVGTLYIRGGHYVDHD
ncbi:hypothetical protein TNCV_103421 [Trichonephila clavipes]|nr:hypothetical protein TNCV_103421 [Trichonephila clavipes]